VFGCAFQNAFERRCLAFQCVVQYLEREGQRRRRREGGREKAGEIESERGRGTGGGGIEREK